MDIVRGIFYVLFNGQIGECYNIANKNSVTSIAEMANIIADEVRVNVAYDLPDDIEAKGYSKPQDCILNTDKIEKLGWAAEYSLTRGIQETLKILNEIELQ